MNKQEAISSTYQIQVQDPNYDGDVIVSSMSDANFNAYIEASDELVKSIATAKAFIRKPKALENALGDAIRLNRRYWDNTYRNRRIVQRLKEEIGILQTINKLIDYATTLIPNDQTLSKGSQVNHIKATLEFNSFELEFILRNNGFLVSYNTYDTDELLGDVDNVPLYKYKGIVGGYSYTNPTPKISGPLHKVGTAIYHRTNNNFSTDDTILPIEKNNVY